MRRSPPLLILLSPLLIALSLCSTGCDVDELIKKGEGLIDEADRAVTGEPDKKKKRRRAEPEPLFEDEEEESYGANRRKRRRRGDKEAAAIALPCPNRFKELISSRNHTCSCPANPPGSVWGSGVYADGSSICISAVHAGVIQPNKGGNVLIDRIKGCERHDAVPRNGVRSRRWGSSSSSYYFPESGVAKKCPSGPPVERCPDSFKRVAGFNPKKNPNLEITCRCDDNTGGSVWGSGVYLTDSAICSAAGHAGLIGKEGGVVKAKAMKGCKVYRGTNRNGVESKSWKSFRTSFYFPEAGPGVCSK